MTQQPRPADLTADAFLEWAILQSTGRFELLCGEIVAMARERAGHARVKTEALISFRAGIAAAELGCEAFADGMAVRIDERTVYEPDVMIRCGPRTPNDAVELNDPVVVVEVVSPSSRGIDAGTKLADYFRIETVRHYLVVQPEARRVIHHRRTEGGDIVTRVLHDGAALTLDPPGIDASVSDLFATL